MRQDARLQTMQNERYASWDNGIGAEIEAGKHDFKSLEAVMLEKGDIGGNRSGRQELFENVINTYL